MTQPQYPDSFQPGQGSQDAPGAQGFPQAPPVPAAYGYGTQQPMAVPQGMYFDPNSELTLPDGVQLASVGRRIGAYFLSHPPTRCVGLSGCGLQSQRRERSGGPKRWFASSAFAFDFPIRSPTG
jgi:hypothetical protein